MDRFDYRAIITVVVAPFDALLLLKKESRASVGIHCSRIGKPKSQLYTERQKEIYHILREMHQKGI